jgi:hypothetical protein
MEIDKQILVKVLEAFADTSERLQHELMLYQSLFAAACKTAGLNESETRKAVERGREAMYDKIKLACQEAHQDLLGKLPQIVELLDSNRDEAFRLLKEWTPKGPPN